MRIAKRDARDNHAKLEKRMAKRARPDEGGARSPSSSSGGGAQDRR
jgi:hypothetical protein